MLNEKSPKRNGWRKYRSGDEEVEKRRGKKLEMNDILKKKKNY